MLNLWHLGTEVFLRVSCKKQIKMTLEASFMTFGYRVFFDISMEKSRYKWHRMLNLWHLGIELFLTFSWKNPEKWHRRHNLCHLGIELFLTFSWKNLDKNDIGRWIHDIWVSSFFWRFMERPIQNWHWMLNLWHLGIELFLTFPWKNPYKTNIGCWICDIWVSSFFWHFRGKSR